MAYTCMKCSGHFTHFWGQFYFFNGMTASGKLDMDVVCILCF